MREQALPGATFDRLVDRAADDKSPDAFQQVIQEVCEPIFAKPLNEISFGLLVQKGRSEARVAVRYKDRSNELTGRLTFDLNERIKLRLDEEGISIPFPQRDLHVRSVAPGVAADLLPATQDPRQEPGSPD